MKQREGSALAALLRAQGFLDANAGKFVSVNASTARRALDDAVAQLGGHAVNQSGGHRSIRGEGARQRSLKRALRQLHMQPIVTAARLEIREGPEFADLTVPFSHLNLSRLIAAAKSMSEAAKKHEAQLIQAGLPDDFIAKLDAATALLEQSIGARSAGVGRREGATKALSQQNKRGRSVLRILDAILRPIIGADDDLLGQWNAAKRIPFKSGPVAGTEEVIAPVPIALVPAAGEVPI